MHLELCTLSKTLCIIVGVQTACEIGVIIMMLTGTGYNLYSRYFTQGHNNTNSLKQITVTIILSILQFIKITFLSRVCKHAADEVIYFAYYFTKSLINN